MENDYSGLCLLGSKECTRIHELIYTDLNALTSLEVAHTAFVILSFINAIGPMFAVNAWITPESSRYETSIKNNGFQDFWRISYLFYAIEYGIPAFLSPLTYVIDSGQLRRIFEAWWGSWNFVVMTLVLGFQIFMFWPNDYYLGDFPWEVMFVYSGVYTLHLLVWIGFRRNLYRWAYGVDAIVENLDREYVDYCCTPVATLSQGEVGPLGCTVHHEDRFLTSSVCGGACLSWGYCEWYDTIEEIEDAISARTSVGQIVLLEGETVDYCCANYNEEIELFLCRTVP